MSIEARIFFFSKTFGPKPQKGIVSPENFIFCPSGKVPENLIDQLLPLKTEFLPKIPFSDNYEEEEVQELPLEDAAVLLKDSFNRRREKYLQEKKKRR